MRAPWPKSCLLAGTGLMLGHADPKTDALIVYEKPPDQGQVAPSDFGEQAENPIFGSAQPYNSLALGFGLRTQRAFDDERYYYTLNADVSGGAWVKGPSLTTGTPATRDATNGITRAFEMGGNLYFLNGRYVLVRSSDSTFAVSKDFGAGNAGVDAVAFHSNGAAARLAFVAMGDSTNLWYFDAATTTTTWTQHASLKARAFAVAGKQLFRFHSTNTASLVDTDADPTVAANWSALNSFPVGSKDYGVTRVAVLPSTTAPSGFSLAVLKQDGIFTIDADGEDHELFPFLRLAPSATNGEPLGYWLNDAYVGYGSAFYRLSGNGTLEQVGPELVAENDSPVKGRITAACGTDYGLYAGLYNPDTGASYLVFFQGRFREENGQRVPVWHGSITAAFSGKSITLLHKSAIGAPTGHSRLWLGFSDGTHAVFTLPCVPNPAGCSAYGFSTDDGYVYLPTAHFRFPSAEKAMQAVSVTAPNLSTSNYAQFQYRTAGSGAYTALGTDFNTGVRQEVEFPTSTSAILLDPLVVLKSTSTSASPQITQVAIKQQLRTPLRDTFTFYVLAEDGLRSYDGTPLRLTADQIVEAVESAVDTAGSVAFVGPDETSMQIACVTRRKVMAWDRPNKKYRAALAVTAVQTTRNVIYGTHARMMVYRHAELMSYTHAQLMAL